MIDDLSWQSLLDRAVAAARHAYAPYSNYAVGAALMCTDGTVFTSANMENASYGLSLCAETGALHASSAAGKLADVSHLAVVGGPAGGPVTNDIVTPCGRCRQLINEASHLRGAPIPIACGNSDGSHYVIRSSDALLPFAFGPADLSR